MNNIFGNLNTEGLKQAKDSLGGGFVLDSDVYTGKIKAAYAGKSDGGANSMTFVVTLDVKGEQKEYREVVWVTNKQGQPYYERNGEKSPLPGFTTANDICLVTTGHDLANQAFEERVINVYNREQQGEVPTKVQMATGLIGQEVTLAILKQTVDKTKKNEATNQYEPTGETRDENAIDKAFHADSGRTVSEIVRKLEKGEFIDQWKGKYAGTVRDKTSKTGATGGAKPGLPGMTAAAGAGAASAAGTGKSLFG